jgi:hypothetical protein
MIKRTLWKPDTCDCEVEYEWDDKIPAAERTIEVKAHKACPLHTTAAETFADNQRKNQEVDAFLNRLESDGKKATALDVAWELDDKRNLTIACEKFGITEQIAAVSKS